jgi:branched-chain amino acid aminotransferase
MTVLINIDGAISTPEQAKISVLDRGFLYGDSVYEVVRTYEGRIFALSEHMKRLEGSAARLHIDLPDRGWLEGEVARTLNEAGNAESYCRIIVTRGSGPITLDPTTAEKSLTVIIAKPYEPFPARSYQQGIKIAIPNIRRTARVSLDPAIKSGNYLNSVLALGEARRAGFEDALMLDHQGLITEATAANVFLYTGGELRTPALEHGILAGVTRGMLIGVARENGYDCQECELTPADLEHADELMLTSTLREVQPVVRVGETVIGDGKPGPVAKRLRELFHEYALSRVRGSER